MNYVRNTLVPSEIRFYLLQDGCAWIGFQAYLLQGVSLALLGLDLGFARLLKASAGM